MTFAGMHRVGVELRAPVHHRDVERAKERMIERALHGGFTLGRFEILVFRNGMVQVFAEPLPRAAITGCKISERFLR